MRASPSSAAPAGSTLGLRALLVLFLFPGGRADINFTAFSRDPKGSASHLRLLGTASVDYYSTEFVELCPNESAAAVNPPIGITQRFQHPEYREDPHYSELPSFRYMDDGQLDNPYSGRISFGEHTEVVVSKEFVRDSDVLPLPHNRTQLCHYALRLTTPHNSQNSAAWYRFKQLVAYGFETEFHFRILHRSKECMAAGRISDWCHEVGGDGFAFVVQNFGRKVVGTEVNGLGYSFKNNLVVEFDTYRNEDLGETSANHISVMVPVRPDQDNTAHHDVTEIAYSSDFPPLQEGTHVVRIEYDVKQYRWDRLLSKFESDMNGEFMTSQASGRPGLFTVDLDGRRIIAVPVDLAQVVGVDNFEKYQADPPMQPNKSAYDELGSTPGRAWVGFTSSTSYSQSQSVDILSWTFMEKPSCPGAGASETLCRVDEGTANHHQCAWNGDMLCSFIVQNAARQPILLSGRSNTDKPFQAHTCSAPMLEWDVLHPYFLGCSRPVRFTHDLAEVWANTLDGTRAATVSENYILGKDPMPFRRQSIFKYCITEHKDDPLRLYFAECNCEYCVRLLTLQNKYSVFYQQKCTFRYGLLCPCFEVSEMMPDASKWSVLEPMKFMRLHICRGCVYPSQCSMMLKVATCEQPRSSYRIGNPLAPVPLANGFQNLSRDDGRVEDGRISGDSCNCEPEVRPYRGDEQGRSGMCATSDELDRDFFPDLDGCTIKCKQTAKCAYLTFWETGECRVYAKCEWELCTTQFCFLAFVYRLAPLGSYTDTRGQMQAFKVYPLRTVQTRPEDCKTCLSLYDEEHCFSQCGQPKFVPYLHWPGGQSCATCIFAGNIFHELTVHRVDAVKRCVYDATRNGQDPWVVCDETAQEQANVHAVELFNGVSTHFLTECPGRPFAEGGAVCVPNVLASNTFPSQILSRMSAIHDTVWGDSLECINSICRIVPRSTCYVRLAQWFLVRNFDDFTGSIKGTSINGANIRGQELILRKNLEQYVVSEPLPFLLENTTIEAWVTVGEAERITNMAANRPIVADSHWKEDYMPLLAVDGDLETYWSSQLGQFGTLFHNAVWEVDLGELSWAGGVIIHWYHHASDFTMSVSDDNMTWRQVLQIEDNELDTFVSDQFFRAQFVRLEMTKAAALRPQGPGENRPVFSIREFEAFQDINLARLKDSNTSFAWQRHAKLALDNDNTTYWLTPPNTLSADLFVDFGSRFDLISAVEIDWKFAPQKVSLLVGEEPCDVAAPTKTLELYSGAQVTSHIEDTRIWSGQCLHVQIQQTKEVYGVNMVGMTHLGVYRRAFNLARIATVQYSSPLSGNAHLTPLAGCLDGDPTTYWLFQPVAGTAQLTLDFGSVRRTVSMEVRWAEIDGQEYKASRFAVSAGVELHRLEEIDRLNVNFERTHRFVAFMDVRFVQLNVEQVIATNPEGRLGLEDFIINEASDNLASRNTTVATTSSEWANCTDCNITIDGGVRLHAPSMAVDGDIESWWGAALGFVSTVTYDIELADAQSMEMVVVWWRWPAIVVSAWCSFNGVSYTLGGSVETNIAYLTPIVFSGPRACRVVRLIMSNPLETFAGEAIVGIREVQLRSFAENLALNRPIVSSDGSQASRAVDASASTKWISKASDVTNLTVDLETNVSAWGMRLMWSSGMQPTVFYIAISDDNVNYRIIKEYLSNRLRTIHMVDTFVARYVRLILELPLYNLFGLRTLAVYSSPDLAHMRPTSADQLWDHAGPEATDGNNSTFWIAEPFATSAKLSVDFLSDIFVAGGVTILWKFPAEDFSVWFFHTNHSNGRGWQLLYSATGNLDNVTWIETDFEARYIELRMTRPSQMNGNGAYGLYSLDVWFDPNLAHGKYVTATETIDADAFVPEKAIDAIRETIWFPKQDSSSSRLILNLNSDYIISGLDIHWRWPPVTFSLERQEPDDGLYYFVKRWTKREFDRNVGETQIILDGFTARRVAIVVEAVEDSPEGKIVALREVLIHTPFGGLVTPNNKALYRPVEVMDDIPGNPKIAAVDGNTRGTYWMPHEGTQSGWLILLFADELEPIQIARLVIRWRFDPGTFYIDFWVGDEIVRVHQETDSTDKVTDLMFLRWAYKMKITIVQTISQIGIFEIEAYEPYDMLPPAVDRDELGLWVAPVSALNDRSTGTFWMAPPHAGRIEIVLDLFHIYQAFDITIWFGFKAEDLFLFISTNGVEWKERAPTSTLIWGFMRLEDTSTAFPVRYVKLLLQKSYNDPEDQLGTSIRDIAVELFRNLARGKSAGADSVWDYPPEWAVDGRSESFWMARLGQREATLNITLDKERNIAGVTLRFGYVARVYQIWYSLNGVEYKLSKETTGNGFQSCEVDSKKFHFRAKYVQLRIMDPKDTIFHPDDFGNDDNRHRIMSIVDLELWEHTGGGGVVGLQSPDGKQFNTIAYGLLQPGEWVLASEDDVFTMETGGANFPEDVGAVVHLAATFRKVEGPPDQNPRTEVMLYRNGVAYGQSYVRSAPASRFSGHNATRLIMGVRSTIYANASMDLSQINGVHGDTHPPYFEGKVHNVTILQNALNAEEVRGLFNMVKGGQELGCHCFNACPWGSNRFFPLTYVPCSGQGVCLRSPTGAAFSQGRCECLPGYSGAACEFHCSTLSTYGCCEVDDDCPKDFTCDQATKACGSDTSLQSEWESGGWR